DDLEVVESHLMPGGDDEALIGRVRGTHQHSLEALVLGGPFREIDGDFIESLLIEEDRAFRAENLQLQPPLAAPGAAADLDPARGAVAHAQEDGRDVKILDSPPAAAVRPV